MPANRPAFPTPARNQPKPSSLIFVAADVRLTYIANLDHVTMYLGQGLLAAHSSSCQDVSANTWYQSSEPLAVRHLIHILDAPTLNSFLAGKNLVLSWGTNWSGYPLYSTTNVGPGTTWTKVAKSPAVKGVLNTLTNTMPASGAIFYRLIMP